LSEHLSVNLAKLEAEDKLKILDLMAMKKDAIPAILESILSEATSIKAKRLVVDSFTVIAQAFKKPIDVRAVVQTVLSKIVRQMGATTIIVEEIPMGQAKVGFSIEEFVADGIIILKRGWLDGHLFRELEIVKLRGIELKEQELLFTLKNGFKAFPPFKPKLVEKPERFKPIKDLPNKFSTGNQDLDEMLEGGLPKGSIMLLEVDEKVSMLEYQMISFSFGLNFVVQGRGVLILPSSGVDYEFIKKRTLSYGISEEEFKNLALIFDYFKGDKRDKPNLVQVKGDSWKEDFHTYEEAMNELLYKTGKPILSFIGLDTLIAIYGEEAYEKILNLIITSTRKFDSATMLIAKPIRKTLSKKLGSMVDFYLRLTREHGSLLLYGIKPRTGIYVMEMDVSKGYPLPKLTPIV
jgi:KaiC/GvpD/RAD55 family RecA-like ATPase